MTNLESKSELEKPYTLESRTETLIKKFESINAFKRLGDLNFGKNKIKTDIQKLDGGTNKGSILQTFSLEQNGKKVLELRIFNKPNGRIEVSNTFGDFGSIESTSKDLESNFAAIDKFIQKFKEYEKFENQKKFDKERKEQLKLNKKIEGINKITKNESILDPEEMLKAIT